MNFFNTFRGRLMIILAFLLIATLGVQYYLNLKPRRKIFDCARCRNRRSLPDLSLGSNGITSSDV